MIANGADRRYTPDPTVAGSVAREDFCDVPALANTVPIPRNAGGGSAAFTLVQQPRAPVRV